MAANNAQVLFRGKSWCFTLNNPQPSSLKDLDPSTYEYLVYGREKAPGTGTEHLQGFVVFKDRKRRAQVSKLIPNAWLEPAKGTPKEASDYCKKDGDFVEEGVLPEGQTAAATRAAKEKWAAIKKLAIAGEVDSLEGSVFVPHYRNLKQIESDYAPRAVDLDDVCGIWYVGEPGCGKSHAARSLDQGYYLKPMNKWWDGFIAQKHQTVVLEDLDLEQTFMGHYLKNWADKWSFAAEKKGATIQIRPKRIVVTSNYTIEQIWSSDPALVQALKRRFKVTVFPPRNSPFNPMNSPAMALAQLVTSAVQTSAQPSPPGTPVMVGTPLRRQNAVVFSRETVGDLFEWDDEDQSQRVVVPEEDSSDDDGAGVGTGK